MWDARNRLAAITGPVTASFIYDAMGRRSQKTINGVSTYFVYDFLNPVQEQSAQTVTNLLTGLGIDEYVSRGDGLSAVFLLADALGSTLALTDGTATVNTTYTYEPFGAVAGAGAPSTNPFQYTGRENDATGLYSYRARYYHATFQRFIAEDPAGAAGGDPNLFIYVGNSPIVYKDPWGLTRVTFTPITVSSGGVGATVGTAAGTAFGIKVGGEIGTTLGMMTGFAVGGALGLGGGPLGSLGGGIVGGAVGGTAGGVAGGIIGGALGGAIGGLFDGPCSGKLNCDEMLRPSMNPTTGGGKSGP
jgi:RHS repeat-associated protein